MPLGHRRWTMVGVATLGLVVATAFQPTSAAMALRRPLEITTPSAPASPTDARIALRRIATGLSEPVFVTGAHDGTDRLFIVEQTGKIKIYRHGRVRATPFLSIAGLVSHGTEQGLLGLAFHPNFASNRKLYVDYTNRAGDTVIREFKASITNPNMVAAGSGRTVLKIHQPYDNHNGGMLEFGAGGKLFIGMGDGGSGGDPGNRAQSKDTLLGKILRIDIDGQSPLRGYRIPHSNPFVGKPGRDEIWQLGLRNPWRFSFDRMTGNLWIGDVGQARYEEIDRAIQTSTGAGRGFNWGWRTMEGFHCYSPTTGCNKTGRKKPLLTYPHSAGGCAVIGGYVYRGAAIPTLVGGYLFGDLCTGEIWVTRSRATMPASKTRLLDTTMQISSFGRGDSGELLVCNRNGSIFRMVQG